MRSYLSTAAVILALATPASVMGFGAPCAKARVMEDACCTSSATGGDGDHNQHIDRACCCEIGDAPGAVAHDVTAVLDSSEPAPAADAAASVTFVAQPSRTSSPAVHPDARGPPAANSLFSQRIALLI